jgi:hypothetical protein
MSWPSLALMLTALVACRDESRFTRRSAAVVDSVVAPDVALARFRAGLTEPAGLIGGAPTRDSLFALALAALTARDTAAIPHLTLTRAEFAWLYYPTNPQAYPPYDLDPELMWFLLISHSEEGLHEALRAYGGQRLRYRDGRCEGDSSVQGPNVLWGPCWLAYSEPDGQWGEERLLSLVMRRGGRYKIVSWSNKLD